MFIHCLRIGFVFFFFISTVWTLRFSSNAFAQRNPRNRCITSMAHITMGRAHTCARNTSRTYTCWGDNHHHQLGRDDIPNDIARSPTHVPLTQFERIFHMSTGRFFTCAIPRNEALYCWGDNIFHQIGRGEEHVPAPRSVIAKEPSQTPGKVSSGWRHSCADVSGTIYCWGDNQYGQSNPVSNDEHVDDPAEVPTELWIDKQMIGGNHSCLLYRRSAFKNQHLGCWGDNQYKQINSQNAESIRELTEVHPVHGEPIDGAAGGQFTCVVIEDGTVECWGRNQHQQLGLPIDDLATRSHLSFSEEAYQVTAGENHACVLHKNGKVKCWGDNRFGQLGRGTEGGHSKDPEYVILQETEEPLSDVVYIAASPSSNHTCAIVHEGRMYCWGSNHLKQLGNLNVDSTNSPSAIPVLRQPTSDGATGPARFACIGLDLNESE